MSITPFLSSTPERNTAVYQWVSSFFDQMNIRVDCGGNVHHPHYTALTIDLALLTLNGERDRPLRPFPDNSIRAAIALVTADRRRDRLSTLIDNLSVRHAAEAPEVIRSRLSTMMALGLDEGNRFDADDAAALICKTIWQCKRKMANLPVTNHTMLVFAGPQRGGKSTLVNALTSPVREVTVSTDLREITDNRNMQLFSNFVGIIDELDKADRTSVESLKRVITETTMARRVLGTNRSVNISQSLTFLGTSNRNVAEAIIDETGNRRFVQLSIVGPLHPNCPAYWAAVADFDWLALWRSVDETADDPTVSIAARITKAQHAERNLSNIETWLQQAEVEVSAMTRLHAETSTVDLYASFREWEAENAPAVRSSLIHFSRTFARLAQHGTIPFQPRRTAKAAGYVCTGPIDPDADQEAPATAALRRQFARRD